MQIAMWTTESVGVLRRGSANLLKLTLTWAAFESESVADRLDWTSCKTRFGGAFLGIAPLIAIGKQGTGLLRGRRSDIQPTGLGNAFLSLKSGIAWGNVAAPAFRVWQFRADWLRSTIQLLSLEHQSSS